MMLQRTDVTLVLQKNDCYVHLPFSIGDDNGCKTNSVFYFKLHGRSDVGQIRCDYIMFVECGLHPSVTKLHGAVVVKKTYVIC